MNAFSVFADQYIWHIAGWTMLHYLWLGTLVGIFAIAPRLLLCRAAANVRYAAALVCLAILTALPVAIAIWLTMSPDPPLASAARPILPPINETPIIELTDPATNPPRATSTELSPPLPIAVSSAPSAAAADAAAPQSTASSSPPADLFAFAAATLQSVVPYFPWLWIIGTPITFALLAAGVVGTKRLRHASHAIDDPRVSSIMQRLSSSLRISQRVTIAVCDRIAAPVLVGIVRPIILLPPAALTGWSPDEIEMVLLHELAHVRRWDNLVNLIQRLIESLLFFHPAVWVVSTWVRREREQCCDAFVVRRTEKPHAYAELLVNLASQPKRGRESFSAAEKDSRPLFVGTAMSAGPLRSRIRRILKLEDDPMLISGKSLALTLAGLLVAATLAVLHLPTLGQAEETTKDETKGIEAKDKQDEWPLGEKVARSLADAVKEFNEKAKRDRTGRTQPPLTEDEVIAAIRGWIREQTPVSDEVFATYQKIAETKQLPPGASLSYTTRWINRSGYDFKVWWIDLSVSTGPKSGYGFRIRDTKLSSTPPAVSGTADDEIEILKQHVAILEQQLKRVDALRKTASPGGTQEQYAAAAYELASAKGELALAQSDRKTAIALFEEALKYAEAALSAVKSAHELGKVDQGAVFRATTNLFNIKLKLVRAQQEVPGRRLHGQSVETIPGTNANVKTEIGPADEAPLKSDKSALRYEGKSFDEWRDLWQNELSAAKRAEAVRALAEFATAGYGKEATGVILDVAGNYDFLIISNDPEGKLKQAVIDELTPDYPRSDLAKYWLPDLVERFKKDPDKWKHLASHLLYKLRTNDPDTIALLQSLVENGPAEFRTGAMTALVGSTKSRNPDNTATVDEKTRQLLANALRGDDPAQMQQTLWLLLDNPSVAGGFGAWGGGGMGSNMPPPNLIFLPELVPLLFRDDELTRLRIRNVLQYINDKDAPQVVEQLVAILKDDSRKKDHLNAIRALAAMGKKSQAAVPQLANILKQSDDKQILVAALVAVTRICGEPTRIPKEGTGTTFNLEALSKALVKILSPAESEAVIKRIGVRDEVLADHLDREDQAIFPPTNPQQLGGGGFF